MSGASSGSLHASSGVQWAVSHADGKLRPRSCTQPSKSADVILLGTLKAGCVGDEERDWCVFVRDAVGGQVAVEREVVGREAGIAQVVGRVVLLDDRTAIFHVGEQCVQGRPGARSVRTFERAYADDHCVEPAQAFGREVRAGERRDVVAHRGNRLCRAVARAGQVADLLAADLQIEADGLHARGRLEELRRDVVVADFLAGGVVGLAVDGGTCGEKPGRGLRGRGDVKRQVRVVARRREFERLRRG